MWRALILVICCSLTLSLFSELVLARDDPLEVLAIAFGSDLTNTFSERLPRFLKRDPLIEATLVPGVVGGADQDMRSFTARYRRLYFPRTYEVLVEKYEFILLEQFIADSWSAEHEEWMRKAIEEEGLGSESRRWGGLFEGQIYSTSQDILNGWAMSGLSDAFPVDDAAVLDTKWIWEGHADLFINQEPTLPPVFRLYEDVYSSALREVTFPYVLVIPRQGSQTYVWMKTPRWGQTPAVLGWRYGKGYTWTSIGKWWLFFVDSLEYGPDVYFAMMMYSTGRELPQDVVMVHEIRERFGEYAEAEAWIGPMIDFIEKFDFNINPMLIKSHALLERWRDGKRLYMAQEYEESYIVMNNLAEDVTIFIEEVLTYKDQALFWVYVTEWVTITGTALIAGFLLWTLMVSRRFYRKIDQTRLRPPPREVGTEPTVYRDDNRPWWRKGELSRLFTIRLQDLIH